MIESIPTAAVEPWSDERRLVARLLARDEAACEAWVRATTPRLLAVCRRFLRSDEDARDAVQESYFLAFRGLAEFGGGSRLSTWLHSIAVHVCLTRLRSRRRKPETPIETWLPVFDDHGRREHPFPASDLDPVDALDAEARRRVVRAAIEALPERYRQVLLLRDVEELDTRETARLLGIRPEAVKMRLHRARQALRTLLEPRLVARREATEAAPAMRAAADAA